MHIYVYVIHYILLKKVYNIMKRQCKYKLILETERYHPDPCSRIDFLFQLLRVIQADITQLLAASGITSATENHLAQGHTLLSATHILTDTQV